MYACLLGYVIQLERMLSKSRDGLDVLKVSLGFDFEFGHDEIQHNGYSSFSVPHCRIIG